MGTEGTEGWRSLRSFLFFTIVWFYVAILSWLCCQKYMVCTCEIHVSSFILFNVVYFLLFLCLRLFLCKCWVMVCCLSGTVRILFFRHIIVTFLWALLGKSKHWLHEEVTKQKNKQLDQHPYSSAAPSMNFYASFYFVDHNLCDSSSAFLYKSSHVQVCKTMVMPGHWSIKNAVKQQQIYQSFIVIMECTSRTVKCMHKLSPSTQQGADA